MAIIRVRSADREPPQRDVQHTRRRVEGVVGEARTWLDRERDAVWATKLLIIRVDALGDIRHFGDCLAQHERHVGELARWIGERGVTLDPVALCEPSFATPEPHTIGALCTSAAALYAMEALELARLARYRVQPRRPRQPALGQLLEAHAGDARDRLAWLRRRLRGDPEPS
ncbi:MAG: hypothetical protein FWD17_06515 [Polyangiaceae bacterium]|nr:hypothetical protein [Polyangiaceae bacterium]